MQHVNPVRIDGSVLQCSAFMFSRVLSIALLKYKVPAPIATLGDLHMASSVIFQKYCVLQHFHKYPLMSNSRIYWYLQEGEFFVFNHWNFACQRFFVFKQFDSRSLPRQISFVLIFSGTCWPSWPGLSSGCLKSVSEVRSSKKRVRSVASTACQKLQAQRKV